MAQSYLRNPTIERLPSILEDLYTGALRIPPFQRDFEWDAERRLNLFGSVRLGLPSGSLMVWRTARPLKSENPVGPYLLPSAEDSPPASGYLLDGRQRMTTLFAALGRGFWTREAKVPPVPPFGAETAPDGSSWQIVFDFTADDFVLDSGVAQASLLTEPRVRLPLYVLLDDAAYDDWRATSGASREQVNQARNLRSAFVDYAIPVLPLATEDIGVVTLTFKRVNNGGTPMGDADMARALAWSENFDLREHLEATKESLRRSGWRDWDDDALLKVVAVVADLDPTEVDPEKLADVIRKKPEVVATAGTHILSAADLLADRIGIHGPGSLPYALIMIFAARCFYASGGDLTESRRALLASWVAEVCLDERFGGSPPHMVRADWRALANRLGLPTEEAPRPRDEKSPVSKENWRFSTAWARSRGTALVLASHEPRDSADIPIPDPGRLLAASPANVAMLILEGAQGLPATLSKRFGKAARLGTALRSPANRVICPAHELPQLRERLFDPSCPPSLRVSHLIDEQAHQHLFKGELQEFFERRRQAIKTAEIAWVERRGGRITLLNDARRYADG